MSKCLGPPFHLLAGMEGAFASACSSALVAIVVYRVELCVCVLRRGVFLGAGLSSGNGPGPLRGKEFGVFFRAADILGLLHLTPYCLLLLVHPFVREWVRETVCLRVILYESRTERVRRLSACIECLAVFIRCGARRRWMCGEILWVVFLGGPVG